MKIILADGTELQPLMVTGATRNVHGFNRDCLSFVFDETMDLVELDNMFTEANCENIRIIGDDGSDTIYVEYVVRAELKKSEVLATQENPKAESVYVTRVTVAMAQRTYAESKLAQVASETTDTQLAVAELAEIIMGV